MLYDKNVLKSENCNILKINYDFYTDRLINSFMHIKCSGENTQLKHNVVTITEGDSFSQ